LCHSSPTLLPYTTLFRSFHITNSKLMAATHVLVLIFIVLFTVGFCTRVTSVLTWLAVVGYIHRTNQILFGMDTMMNILLIYLTRSEEHTSELQSRFDLVC